MVLKGRDDSNHCWDTSDSFWDLHSWFSIPPKSCLTFSFVILLNSFGRYLENEVTSFLSVLQINWVNKTLRGGWSWFGMVTVGIDPTNIEFLNGHPTKIPPDKILGGVVQNCRSSHLSFVKYEWNFIHCSSYSNMSLRWKETISPQMSQICF